MSDVNAKSVSKRIVKAILVDLTDRRGLGQEWDAIDEDIQKEIKAGWVAIVVKCLEEDGFE
jgi:hypothetical protein